jgi:hypothetical protein
MPVAGERVTTTGEQTAEDTASQGIRLEVVKLPDANRGLYCCPGTGSWSATLRG